VENEFVVLDLKNPTPREEELLQPNDQALDMYEVLDDKAFESIKNLEYAFQAWSRLQEAYDDTSINSFSTPFSNALSPKCCPT
jgi:hypothetical protein